MVVKAVSGGTFVPADGAVVIDGSSMNIYGTDGTSLRGTATAAVANGVATLDLPAGSTIITDQAGGVSIQDGDGTSATGTAVITAGSNQISYVSMIGSSAIAANAATVQMGNSDGSGLVNGAFVVNSGLLVSANLASAAQTIVANSLTTDVVGYPASSFATLNVSNSGLQNVSVTLPATALLLEDQDNVICNITGNLTNPTGFTVTIAGGAITGIVLS